MGGLDQTVRQGRSGVVPAAVQRLEHRRGAARHHEGVVGGEGEARLSGPVDHGPRRATVHQLERGVVGLVDPPDPENPEEAGDGETGGLSGLLHESGGGLCVARDLPRVAAERDDPIEPRGAEARSSVEHT